MKAFLNSNFSDGVYVQKLNNFGTAIADGKFPTSGNFFDAAPYSRVAFLIGVGSLDSALTVKVQQATAANGTPKDVPGASLTIAATDDDKWGMIEVATASLDVANGYRYLTLDISGAAGANDYLCLFALGLAPHEEPVAQHASCLPPVVVAV